MIEDPDLFSAHQDIFLLNRKFPGMTIERAQQARPFCNLSLQDIDKDDLVEFIDEASDWDFSGFDGDKPDFSSSLDNELVKCLQFVSAWLTAADKYDDYLHNLAASDLAAYNELYDSECRKHEQEQMDLRRKYDANQSIFYRRAPVDFARWLKMPLWRPLEATALSLGLEPDITSLEAMAKDRSRSWIAGEYLDRLRVLERAIESKQVTEPISPAHFITWAKGSDWELPNDLGTGIGISRADLEEQVKALTSELATANKRIKKLEYQLASPETEEPRRLTTLGKLVVGMARAKWFAQNKIQYNKIAETLEQYPALSVSYGATLGAIRDAMNRLEIETSDIESK